MKKTMLMLAVFALILSACGAGDKKAKEEVSKIALEVSQEYCLAKFGSNDKCGIGGVTSCEIKGNEATALLDVVVIDPGKGPGNTNAPQKKVLKAVFTKNAEGKWEKTSIGLE